MALPNRSDYLSLLRSKAVCVGRLPWDHLTDGKDFCVSDVREANHISKAKSDQGTTGSCLASYITSYITRTRALLSCFLLMGSAYLTVYGNHAFCSNQPAEGPVGSTSTAQSTAMGLTKRPATVADSIRMTRLGAPSYTDGAPSNGIVAKFSPDRTHFVVILKKGNLEANTNEYSLVLFQTAEVFRSPKPRVLVSLASSSNRPAIDNVLWLDDNDTILFLGERPGELTQLYSLKCSSKELTKLPRSATNLTSFVTTASGEVIVHTAKNPVLPFLTESVKRKGITVTSQKVTDLIRGSGSYGAGELDDASLFIKRLGQEPETKIATQGRISGSSRLEMSLSPDGTHLILQTEATHVANTWGEYEDQFLQSSMRQSGPPGAHTNIFQYELDRRWLGRLTASP